MLAENKKIPALVMTYDKYSALTEHMIFKYNQLWPEHPFKFIIPYQSQKSLRESEQIQYVQTPSDIKNTVLKLLSDYPEEELIYWCIDDKYPVHLDIPRIEILLEQIRKPHIRNFSGLLFCRCRGMLNAKNFRFRKTYLANGTQLLERNNFEQIWIHQFLKVKVLRNLFTNFPDSLSCAKEMDSLKSKVKLPRSHRLFVTQDSYATFGESATRGRITRNCLESMKQHNLSVTGWEHTRSEKHILMG